MFYSVQDEFRLFISEVNYEDNVDIVGNVLLNEGTDQDQNFVVVQSNTTLEVVGKSSEYITKFSLFLVINVLQLTVL